MEVEDAVDEVGDGDEDEIKYSCAHIGVDPTALVVPKHAPSRTNVARMLLPVPPALRI